ncbi:MAG: helix-turn-helix domain-containing protein [Rickettsiales bacterium]|jgi:transcriptional regulator with XRE-family HTH domain|nr:helix-turn-helix domain-containing protein [Rickettsiales bacterium]
MARKVEHIEQIDRYIGAKIQELRLAHGMSRQDLGEKIEVTHQQLQKYEIGTNRVSAGRLALIAKYLNTSVASFYEGLDSTLNVVDSDINPNPSQRMCIEVSRNFMKIKNPEHKDAINSLVRILAKSGQDLSEEALAEALA